MNTAPVLIVSDSPWKAGKKVTEKNLHQGEDTVGVVSIAQPSDSSSAISTSWSIEVLEWVKKHETEIKILGGGGLIGILIYILNMLKWVKNLFQKLLHFFTRYHPSVPRETIRIIPELRGCWWHMGSSNGQPAMQVVGHFNVTNITDNQVFVLAARISKPRTDGSVSVQHPKHNLFGTFPILPKNLNKISADFWIRNPVRKDGQDFNATLVFVDQFGNEHKVKNVIFKSDKQIKQPKKFEPVIESLYSISDPIEKEIAAVLKAEIHRYRECGRPVGGLGSVQTTYKGRTMHGIGDEWREVGSPKNQSIIFDPQNASIKSDNATALLNLFGKLDNEDGQSRYIMALRKRLSRNSEYASVGYLIFLVLFRIGQLTNALHDAKVNLQKDEAYGFSDLLRLLDGLLRFEHPSFTPELLDEVGRFIENVEEHTFRIQERISAIRAFRLATQNSS
ncbi:hypothetical protein L0337_03870 [candidate division KSB1 bacterium]|nr:hypothetical protein [candidate division KSB1 bacterium]